MPSSVTYHLISIGLWNITLFLRDGRLGRGLQKALEVFRLCRELFLQNDTLKGTQQFLLEMT